MKKIKSETMRKSLILISTALLMTCLVGCGNKSKNEPKNADYTNPTYALLKSCYGGNVDEVRAGMEKDGFAIEDDLYTEDGRLISYGCFIEDGKKGVCKLKKVLGTYDLNGEQAPIMRYYVLVTDGKKIVELWFEAWYENHSKEMAAKMLTDIYKENPQNYGYSWTKAYLFDKSVNVNELDPDYLMSVIDANTIKGKNNGSDKFLNALKSDEMFYALSKCQINSEMCVLVYNYKLGGGGYLQESDDSVFGMQAIIANCDSESLSGYDY